MLLTEMDLNKGKKQSLNISLFVVHWNQLFKKKKSNCLKCKYGKNLISVQMTCTYFENIKRKISGSMDCLA